MNKMKLIQKIVPVSITKTLLNLYLIPIKAIGKLQNKSVPKKNIDNNHIANTKFLTNREELLKLLPKGGIVAELGVDEGNFSKKIIEICNPKTLHLIDVWGTKRYNQNKKISVENQFKNQIYNGQIKINIGLSTEVVNQFQDEYFDWIYIDTTHSYNTTKQELESYRSKIKKNGIIAGHDFIIGNWDKMVKYGVIEAVYEFCIKYDWEIIYLTSEINTNPSFAIRKI